LKLVPVDGNPFEEDQPKQPRLVAVEGNPFAQKTPNIAAGNPEVNLPFGLGTIKGESSGGFNPAAALIQAGSTLDRIGKGAVALQRTPGDMLRLAMGLGRDPIVEAIDREQAANKQPMQDLRDIHPGSTLIGDALALGPMPMRALPVVAATEYGDPIERLTRGGAAYLGGKVVEKGAQIAKRGYDASVTAMATKRAQNAELDATLKAAQDKDFVVPPSTINPNAVNRILESMSGKAATQQAASNINDDVANSIARQAADLPQAAPVTTKAMRQLRATEYQRGYAPIEQAGPMTVTPQYGQALDTITAKNTSAAQSFPGAAAPDIQGLVNGYRPPNGTFDAAHALQATQILRDEARTAFSAGEADVGRAKIQISKEIESEIERQLSAQGKDGAKMLKAFQDARKKMAIAHDIEDAIREGSGSVENRVFGRKVQNQEPLSGDLKIAGDFANNFPKANQPVAQIGSAGVSKLEAVASGIMSGAGGLTLGPMGLGAGLLPLVLPSAARSLLLSKPYQQLMARPKYDPKGLLGVKALDNDVAPWIAGLLGYQGTNP
jgi:hypothetical protein